MKTSVELVPNPGPRFGGVKQAKEQVDDLDDIINYKEKTLEHT